jgi:ribosomal protein S18 acetylase RimI-like enzyme
MAADRAADVVVRPYRPADRDGVRRVCFETGYMGAPIAWQWRDAESFADLFSSHIDHEPGSASVAELDGRVVGYLLGCRDSTTVANPAPMMARHLLRRGLLLRPGTAGVLWRSIGDVAVGLARGQRLDAELTDPRWPADLHINLLPEARGGGVGRRLLTTWLDRLRAEGVAGCHLGTWGENHGAIAFFESCGFRREGPPRPMPGMRSPAGARHTTQWMVQDLAPPGGTAPTAGVEAGS